jgi:RNA polymerase sigma-70 factor (ECF subfamily)
MARVIQRAESLHSPRKGSSSETAVDDFQTIYRENYAAIWRFLLHLGVRKSDVADVTHNVFLVAYRKLATFEHRSSIRTWLCGIALRLGRDFRKSAAVRFEVCADDPEFADDMTSEDAVEIHHDGQLQLAHRLLDQLPTEQREVFVLHELEQMSGSEIAILTGTPLGTVRSRLRRARDSFRKQLAELAQKGALDV